MTSNRSNIKLFLKKLALNAFFICCFSTAKADEISKYVKFSCIPELNYLEITTVASYVDLDAKTRKKYGLFHPKDFECKLFSGEKKITFDYEPTFYPGQCSGDNKGLFKIFENGKLIYSTKGFLDDCFKSAPQVITYDGTKIDACDDLSRICKTINLGVEKITTRSR